MAQTSIDVTHSLLLSSSLFTRNDENKENTTLIWFDPNIDLEEEDVEVTKQQLRSINDFVSFYTDVNSCIQYIQLSDKEKIFLITSGSKASQILPHVVNLNQIDSIFIFCMNRNKWKHLIDDYDKIIDIYIDLDKLCSSLRYQIDLVNKQLQTFIVFDRQEKSTKDLSKQSAEFLWFQLFHHLIIRLPLNRHAKQQMIDFCRNYYRGNRKELAIIDRFEKEYCNTNAIRWYTKQSFLFKLINKALRIEDLNQLQTFRFFIHDLSNNLVKEQEKILSSNETILIVYRGTFLNRKEFEELKANQGKIISTNGYLSTSRSQERAMKFIQKPSKKADDVRVLFQIECHIQQIGKSVTYADITCLSKFPREKEVLFDLNAAFQLISIIQENSIEIIRMNVSNEGERIIKDYLNLTKKDVEDKSAAIVLGQLMCNLGLYDQSQKYFEQLFKESNGEDIAWIEFHIGQVLDYKAQWEQARIYYHRAYERMTKTIPPRIKDSIVVMNNIAGTLYRQGKFDEALNRHKQILQTREKNYPDNQGDIAHSLNYIALILDQQGKYDEALDYHQQALKIREGFYPNDHIDIAASLNNIGHTLNHQGEYDQALHYCQRALTIREQFYPNGHIDTAKSLNTIGQIFENQNKYDEALDCHQRSLQLRKKYLPSGHPHIAISLDNIGSTLNHQKKYDEALQYCREALAIRQASYPDGHVDIAYSLLSIAKCYENQNNNAEALNYYQQALSLFDKYLPRDHPSQLIIKHNIRRITGQH